MDAPEQASLLTPTSFNKLSAWKSDDHLLSLKVFLVSCRQIKKKKEPDNALVSTKWKNWINVCSEAAKQHKNASRAEARRFFERWFRLFKVNDKGKTIGLFTGYYEPELSGSRKKSEKYRFALYMRPSDLVTVNLGHFREKWTGRTISGKIIGNRLVPYPDRRKINDGALIGRGLELFWIDNEIDLFFLQYSISLQLDV